MPVLQPDEVLIRVAYSGICGSELSGYEGKNALRRPPLIMGHEFSGTIEEVGSAVNRPQLMEGQAVTANPLISCGRCSYCLSQRRYHLQNLRRQREIDHVEVVGQPVHDPADARRVKVRDGRKKYFKNRILRKSPRRRK